MDLPEFIRSVGVEEAVKVLGAKERTVRAWLYRERNPEPSRALKIVERTKGKVTFAAIYGEPR